MIVLGVDTSCKMASVAILNNEIIVCSNEIINEKKHASNLMPLIIKTIEEAKINVNEIDLFAISSGPGSFTGLRIGMATVKGLAFSTKKEVVCVPTLDVLAAGAQKTNSIIVPMIDARNNQVYTAIYNDSLEHSEYEGIKIEELITKLKKYNQRIILCGDGAELHFDLVKSSLDNEIFISKENIYPKAKEALKIYYKYEKLKAEEAVPFYLRKSQAERLFKKSV